MILQIGWRKVVISLIQLATAPHHDSPDWLVESRYISLAGKDVRRRQDATKNRA